MKMENPIVATVGGKVAKIDISVGQVVEFGDLVALIEY
jgi:biotin carboxyl carrier protein